MGYATTVWAAKFNRGYGWRRKDLVCQFDRDSFRAPLQAQLLPRGYLAGERNITGKQRGFGRLSADLTWKVLESRSGSRGAHTISGRYPGSKGQLNIRMNPFLAAGPGGHVSTARFEMIREGLQECEARIFIEGVLLDESERARLGDGLAARCERVLNARIAAIGTASGLDGQMGFVGTSRIERNATLFELAGEVAAKVR